MKSKFWVMITLLMVASMILASCAPKTVIQTVEVVKNVEVTPTPLPQGVVKITIFVGFGTGTSPEQQAVHKTVQDKYNSTHTNIQIEFLTVPWADRQTKYATMMAAGNPPDIMLPIGVGGISEFYKGWLDLTPYIQADNYDMTRFAGKTVEIHNYPGQGTLGLPLCVYPTVMYYNRDIFDAAGVAYPPAKFGDKYADGGTWDYNKVVEISKKMTLDANGNDANSPAFDPKTIKQYGWEGWAWGNNIEWAMKFGDEPGTGVTADGKKSLLMTQQYIDAMTFLKDAVWTAHVYPDSASAGTVEAGAGNPLDSGKIGMWEVNSWMGYSYDSWTAKFAWDAGAVPQGPNGKVISMVDADTAVMSGASKHPKEAWEVMKWLFEPDQYKTLIANYSCLPADKAIMSTWKPEQEAKWKGVNFQIFFDALDYIEKAPNHEAWKPNYSQVNTEMSNAMAQIMTGKSLDVQAVMKDADAKVQKILDDYWAANP